MSGERQSLPFADLNNRKDIAWWSLSDITHLPHKEPWLIKQWAQPPQSPRHITEVLSTDAKPASRTAAEVWDFRGLGSTFASTTATPQQGFRLCLTQSGLVLTPINICGKILSWGPGTDAHDTECFPAGHPSLIFLLFIAPLEIPCPELFATRNQGQEQTYNCLFLIPSSAVSCFLPQPRRGKLLGALLSEQAACCRRFCVLQGVV